MQSLHTNMRNPISIAYSKQFHIVCTYQVSQNGLDIIGFMIDRLASDFKPYLNTVLTSIVDRFLEILMLGCWSWWDHEIIVRVNALRYERWFIQSDLSQAGRHQGEREGEGKHRLVQVDGRHSHPPAALWEAYPSFLSQEWQGTLIVLVLAWSPEHKHGVNKSSLINLLSGAWGAASPTTKHT